MRTLLLAGLLVLGPAAPRARAASAGAESFDFLNLDANARAVGLGGAYTALATDGAALHYNPAGLGRARANEASFMHDQFVQGVSQEYLGFASRSGFGAQLNFLSLSGVPRTTISQPDGTGSSFGVSDLALGAGYGRSFGRDFSLGVGGKYLRETIDDVSAGGLAADLGMLYSVPNAEGLTLGASLLNLGPAVRFQRGKSKLPFTGRAGAAYKFEALGGEKLLALDLSRTGSDKVRFGLGLEAVVMEALALRAGFTTRHDLGLGVTAGLGWSMPNLSFDYGFVPLGDLGIAHRVSVALRWGAKPGAPKERVESRRDVEAVFLNAQALIEKRDWTGARERLEEAERHIGKRHNLRVLYYERRAAIARLERRFEEAQQLYLEALRFAVDHDIRNPVVADTYVGLGLVFTAKGDNLNAGRAFRKALEVGPTPRATAVASEEMRKLDAPRQ